MHVSTLKTLLDSRKQQSPSSSVFCSTGHNRLFNDESSYEGSLDFLEDDQIGNDNSSRSIDSAIIDDDNTEQSTYQWHEYHQAIS